MSVTLTLTESNPISDRQAEDGSSPVTRINKVGGEEEEEVEDIREAELIVFENTSQGLGLKICGGCSPDGKEDYGIFIKRVLPGGLAEIKEEVFDGDLILEVNGQSMQGITYDRAVSMLRQASASNHVELVITRDADAQREFAEYLSKFGPVHSPQTVRDYSEHVADTEPEFHRKIGTVLKDTQLDLNNSGDQSDLRYSGKYSEQNGHISPSSSCASEVANHMGEPLNSPRPIRPMSNGSSASRGKETPSDYLDSVLSKKLSQDPGLKLHIDQLEAAITNLGLQLTPSTQASLRQNLNIDPDGMVRFEEFVEAAKNVFHDDLDVLKGLFAPQVQNESYQPNNVMSDDYASVVRERDQLRQEVAALKEELRSRNHSSQSAEEQLLFIRKQAQASIEEGRSLKSKLHLAEQAQAKAQQTERDYEEVVAMLENEVAQLRLQMSKSDGVNMQKRLAVLVCQLKKAESGKKTYEVATEKLMRFVEHTQDVLASVETSPRIVPEGTNAKMNKKRALTTLSNEGRDVIKTVRSLMETVPLPFGWEEAYTAEGIKYYINHLNQTTTWTHPVSCMEHQTAAKAPPPPAPQHSSPPQQQKQSQIQPSSDAQQLEQNPSPPHPPQRMQRQKQQQQNSETKQTPVKEPKQQKNKSSPRSPSKQKEEPKLAHAMA